MPDIGQFIVDLAAGRASMPLDEPKPTDSSRRRWRVTTHAGIQARRPNGTSGTAWRSCSWRASHGGSTPYRSDARPVVASMNARLRGIGTAASLRRMAATASAWASVRPVAVLGNGETRMALRPATPAGSSSQGSARRAPAAAARPSGDGGRAGHRCASCGGRCSCRPPGCPGGQMALPGAIRLPHAGSATEDEPMHGTSRQSGGQPRG